MQHSSLPLSTPQHHTTAEAAVWEHAVLFQLWWLWDTWMPMELKESWSVGREDERDETKWDMDVKNHTINVFTSALLMSDLLMLILLIIIVSGLPFFPVMLFICWTYSMHLCYCAIECTVIAGWTFLRLLLLCFWLWKYNKKESTPHTLFLLSILWLLLKPHAQPLWTCGQIQSLAGLLSVICA